jgi:predicted flap endonuclease-1-like 5' DNA nuclease
MTRITSMELAPRTRPIHRDFPRITLVPSNPQLRPAKAAVALGLSVLVVSTIGMLREVEPFATWYYQFAWYSVILTADGALALVGSNKLKRGEFLLLGKPLFLLSMLGWSAVAWFFYELLNFRLQNWYYVFLPDSMAVRWFGTTVAFATVLPAVFLAEAVLSRFGFAHGARTKPMRVTPRTLTGMRVAGAAIMALVMLWPRYFFALVWGASMLMIEPSVYERSRERSLLHDLEVGKPGRLLRLLAGGAAIGLLWESLNIGARAKWIYTVPFLENLKLFEMPVPGFLGFPPFAVECFIIWQALVTAGLAVPRFGSTFSASTKKRVASALGAFVFSLIVLVGMELWTFTSSKPRITDLPDVQGAALERAGYDVFRLANTMPSLVAADAGVDRATAQQWVERAGLASLRGIGTNNLILLQQLGINSVEQLAATDPAVLVAKIEEKTGEDWVDARVRVWVRGARRMLGEP